jgi:16S rRNA (uracil1498-N3)-methyltransferase
LSERPRTRLYVEEPLEAGTPVRLPGDRAHFLRNVLRLEAGAAVALFNGRDGEWLARIGQLSKSAAVLDLVERRREQQPAADLWLLFAPIKGGRIDSVAEKATELGVAELHPVFTRRTDAQRVNVERLRANAVEAAEQCERLDVPVVREPLPLDRILAEWPEGRTLFVCAEAGEAVAAAEAFAARAGQPAAFLIGPEGGFADAELDELRKRSFVVPVGLGPRILRADTAAFAALACWQSLAGDWTRAGRDRRPRPVV